MAIYWYRLMRNVGRPTLRVNRKVFAAGRSVGGWGGRRDRMSEEERRREIGYWLLIVGHWSLGGRHKEPIAAVPFVPPVPKMTNDQQPITNDQFFLPLSPSPPRLTSRPQLGESPVSNQNQNSERHHEEESGQGGVEGGETTSRYLVVVGKCVRESVHGSLRFSVADG